MPRFRKKPLIVYAERWFSDKHVTGVQYRHDSGLGPGDEKRIPYIPTLEGEMSISEGDWIITGVRGEKYLCKDKHFQQTYDPVFEPLHGELPETD